MCLMLLLSIILGSPVEAIILESPYTRIGEVVVIHPLAKVRAGVTVFSLSAAAQGVTHQLLLLLW